MMRIPLIRLSWIILTAAWCTGATYYVNGTTGDDTRTRILAQTESAPWATVQTGADSAEAGDTVLVAAGVYKETVYLSGTAAGSARLTIRGMDPDVRPVMDGDSSNLYTRAFAVVGDPNVTIENFEIKDYYTHGIQVYNESHGVTVRNCYVHHNNRRGIGAENSDNLTVENCLILGNSDCGINFTKGHDLSVDNCEITLNFGEAGIWASVASNIYIRNTFIHEQPENPLHADNLQLAGTSHIRLENCVFIQDGQQNMWCESNDDFIMINNIFMGGPLGINDCYHTQLYHNVFYRMALLRFDMASGAGFEDVDIQNNMIVESGIWIAGGYGDSVFTIDHNYINLTGSTWWNRITDWTPWVDSTSVLENDPSLAADLIAGVPDESLHVYDFHPVAGSWLIDRGTEIAGIDTDKDGNGRVTGSAPDIGPYEYSVPGSISDGKTPDAVLPRIFRITDFGHVRIIIAVGHDAERIAVTDVTGRTAATLSVREGRALLEPARHGMRDGLYILRTGDGQAVGKIIITP